MWLLCFFTSIIYYGYGFLTEQVYNLLFHILSYIKLDVVNADETLAYSWTRLDNSTVMKLYEPIFIIIVLKTDMIQSHAIKKTIELPPH